MPKDENNFDYNDYVKSHTDPDTLRKNGLKNIGCLTAIFLVVIIFVIAVYRA